MKKIKANRLNTATRGFTLVEIFVVVTVVGILAAVSVVGFGSWRARVATTEVKNDLIGAKSGMEDVRNRTNGYPVLTGGTVFNGTNSSKSIYTQSKNVTLTYVRGGSSNYCINAQSTAVSSVSMFIDMATSNKNPQNGTC